MRQIAAKVVRGISSVVFALFGLNFVLLHFGTGIAVYILLDGGIVGVICGLTSLLFPVINILVTFFWGWYVSGTLTSNYAMGVFQLIGLGILSLALLPLRAWLNSKESKPKALIPHP